MTIEKLLNFTNEEYNDNHRKWGAKLYATDVDMIEYDQNCEPQIMVETKHGFHYKTDLNNFQIKCQLKIAKKLNIPYFLVYYFFPGLNRFNNKVDEFGLYKYFYVYPMNSNSKVYLNKGCHMTEKEYVSFLYKIKNESIPSDLNIDKLDDHLNNNLDEPLILNKKILKGY